jgi:hypothetical protein
LPLACAAAISGLEFPDAVLIFLGEAAVVEAGVVLVGFASGVEAPGVGAGAALAGSPTDSVAVDFLRLFLGFLVVSEPVSLDAACGFANAGETPIESSRQSARPHKVRLRLA